MSASSARLIQEFTAQDVETFDKESGSEQNRIKRMQNRENRFAAREYRDWVTFPLDGEYAQYSGQFGALAVARGNRVFGEVPYMVMKSAPRYGALERNLRHAYEYLGEPVYGVHVATSEGRRLVVRKNTKPWIQFSYRWRASEKREAIPALADVEIIRAVGEYLDNGLCTSVVSSGLGFCLKEEQLAFGMLPLDFLRESPGHDNCMKHLREAYACLEDWGQLRMGWIVSYREEENGRYHFAFVAIEHEKEIHDVKLVAYRSMSNMTWAMHEKCMKKIQKNNRMYAEKRIRKQGEIA